MRYDIFLIYPWLKLWNLSAVLIDKVYNFVEIFLFGLIDLLIARKHGDITLAITDSYSSAILWPTKAIKRTAIVSYLLAYYRYLGIGIDVPDVNETFAITRGKDTGMCGTPLSVIDILLRTLEGENWFEFGVGAPRLYCPIHWTW